MRLGRKVSQQETTKILVPFTVFNFEEQRINEEASGRRLWRIAGYSLLVALLASTGFGFLQSTRASSLNAQLDEVNNRYLATSAELASTVGGDIEIPDHVALRREEIESATLYDTDIEALWDALQRSAPANSAVTSVAFSQAPASNQTAEGGDLSDQGDVPEESTVGARKLTVSGVVQEFNAPLEWKANIVGEGLLEDVKVELLGRAAVGLRVRITATIPADTLQTFRSTLLTAIGDAGVDDVPPGDGGEQ